MTTTSKEWVIYTWRANSLYANLAEWLQNNYNLFIQAKIIDSNRIDVTTDLLQHNVFYDKALSAIHEIEEGLYLTNKSTLPAYKKYASDCNRDPSYHGFMTLLVITIKDIYYIIWCNCIELEHAISVELYDFSMYELSNKEYIYIKRWVL